MSYILTSDLKRLIQSDNLNQIIGNDATILDYGIEVAVTEVVSYLVQKYILTDEIKDFKIWEPLSTYYTGDRFILTGVAYDSGNTYNQHDKTLYNGNVYYCLTTTSGTFTPADWELLGANNSLYCALLPAGYVPFDYNAYYSKDDKVFWQNKKYTAKQDTPVISQEEAIQYGNTANLPYRNAFPGTTDGDSYWTLDGAYSIQNQKINNESVFSAGDTRNHQFVNICIDIALYHLHSRIAPRNIPDLRVKRYDDAIAWLKKAANGDITAALPAIQPTSGARIRWGSNIRQNNNY